MKKKLMLIIACCFCFMFVLAGCGGIVLTGGPSSNATVYGNGGLAVRKGSYLYFCNSFKSLETVDVNDNKYGSIKISGVYRVKLNEFGLVDTDEDGWPKGAELLVPQVAGWENSGLYIFGDYLYYTTPKTLKSDKGNTERGLYSFERVKLNGTDHRTLHYTTSSSETFKYTYYQMGNNVYILYFDGTEIHSVEVEINGGRVYDLVLAKKVVSVAFPSSNNHNGKNFNSFIYYTKATTQKTDGFLGGTKLLKAKINGSVKDKLVAIGDKNYIPKQIKNNRLYFELNSKVYSTDTADQTGLDNATVYAINSMSEYYILDDQNNSDRGIVALANFGSNKIVHFMPYSEQAVEDNSTVVAGGEGLGGDVTLIGVVDNFAYYTTNESGEFYRQSIYENYNDHEFIAKSINLTTNSSTNHIDIDGSYVFYYNNVEESNNINYYLHMIKIGSLNEESEKFSQFIGVLSSKDKKKDEKKD